MKNEPTWSAFQGVLWSFFAVVLMAAVAAVFALALTGCRTAGTADQAARLTLKNVTVTESATLTITTGGPGEVRDVEQRAGKEVGLAQAEVAAAASDNAVAGNDASREGAGGSGAIKSARVDGEGSGQGGALNGGAAPGGGPVPVEQ